MTFVDNIVNAMKNHETNKRHQVWLKIREKTHKGENHFKFFLLLYFHKMFNKERVQCSNSSITILSSKTNQTISKI